MKNSLFVLKLCFVCLLITGAAHSAHASVIQASASNYVRASPSIQSSQDFFAQEDSIARTYFDNLNKSQRRNTNWRHKESGNHPSQQTATDVVITYQDFQSHLAVGQDRIVRIFDPSSGTITMDVGMDNLATGEVWNMPNFSPAAFPAGQTITYSSQVVTNVPNYEFFTSEDTETGVVTNPAAAYQLGSGFYQFLDFFVSEFEGETSGTLNSLGYAKNSDIYNFFAALTPIPLSLNTFDNDVSIIGEDCAFFENGCETGNPNEATFDLNQTFEVLASGTLNTYDGESSPGIKLRNIDVYTIYDNNGTVIETRTIRYLLWYTKAGHFFKVGLSLGETWTGVTDLAYLEYHKLSSPALPVEWLSVSAEVVKDSEVKVNWSTASESQNERFVVERSSDGRQFTPIGSLDAVGNSNERQDYTYTDEAPLEGFNYYRIQQQDIDGTYSYSSIVNALMTRTASNEKLVVLYPNPGRDEVFFSQPADYQLLTVDGQLLSEGRAEQQLNVSSLPTGTYLVRIDGGELYRWVKR